MGTVAGLHRSHEAERCSGSGQLQYEPGLADRLHPRANQGDRLTDHEPPVVAARDQGREGASTPATRWPSPARRHRHADTRSGLPHSLIMVACGRASKGPMSPSPRAATNVSPKLVDFRLRDHDRTNSHCEVPTGRSASRRRSAGASP